MSTSGWARRGVVLALSIAAMQGCGDDDGRDPKTDSSVTPSTDPMAEAGVGQPPGQPPGMQPPGQQPPGMQPPEMQPPGMQPPGMPPVGDLDAATPALDAGAPAMGDGGPVQPATHPLAGRYAVRTVSYARQKSSVAGTAVDLVSKGVLLSVADVDNSGLVTERLCLLELYNDEGLATWSSPMGTERIEASKVLLERRGDVFVRPLEEDTTNVAWSNANRPADCPAAGGTHASGCTCVPGDALPTQPTDCRVRDLDGDNLPGLKLSVGAMRPVDPNAGEALFSLQIAGVKAVEWRLPAKADPRLIGTVAGNVEQAQLSVQGELGAQLGQVKNASCPADTGHVELVRGEFDCTQLLAARRTSIDSYGIFDVNLDAKRPEASVCPDPDCATDSDRDGTVDCMDACAQDAAKTAAGACGCGRPETDANQNGTPDCNDVVDMCPNDPNKTAPGVCNCGVADTDTDADGTPDCTDECDADPAKTARGACDCGVAETDTDADGTPDCTDQCDADPAKTAPGVCNCGTPDTDTDVDGTPNCNDQCASDPNKTAPGVCNCGVPDRDLDGNGTIDCSDLCPNDPNKVAPGLCGCGVADTNADGDAEPACRDMCDQNPALLAPGACGCQACAANPLAGTYAVRTTIYGKSRVGGSAATTSLAIGYGLVTVTSNSDGTASMSEISCYAETRPQPTSGADAYGWSSPELNQRLPATVRTVTSSGGTWIASAPSGQLGWSQGRQPTACTQSGSTTMPMGSGWEPSWGSTCTCNVPAGELPPFDRDGAPYDCRLTDPDRDDRPGITLYVSTSPPPANLGAPSGGLTSATVLAAAVGSSRWSITPASNGRHWGTVDDDSRNMVVGCQGGACIGLGSTAPTSRTCPAALNKVQFIPVTGAAATCSSILAQRGSLFDTSQDGPWPSNAACPPP
jgi:hypothetical protein